MLKGWFPRWILNIAAILLSAYVIKGFDVTLSGAFFGSITLGIINAIIRPVVIILTLPINIIRQISAGDGAGIASSSLF